MDFNEELRKLANEYAGRGDARLLNLLNHDRIRTSGSVTVRPCRANQRTANDTRVKG